MPLVDVTCSEAVSEQVRRAVADALPHLVSLAVKCPAEPYDGELQAGDVVVRFRDVGPIDRFDLDVLVEIGSKWDEYRARDRNGRAERVRAGVQELVGSGLLVGVYLRLPVAGWAQSP
ncbi:hypothetical protein [Solicola sp. PLA-1-18]|uniref:hypothetical protein n=1 Tax=Solicola sp. PLA-1-18 TaxID=3380532 RepID=UPI003B79E7CD